MKLRLPYSFITLPTGDKMFVLTFYFFNIFICRVRRDLVPPKTQPSTVNPVK